MARKITLPYIRKEVSKLTGINDEKDPGFVAGVLLISSLQTGPNIKRLSKYTKYSRKDISEYARRCRTNGIWKGGKVCCNWFDKESGSTEFVLDVCVAQGLMNRVKEV